MSRCMFAILFNNRSFQKSNPFRPRELWARSSRHPTPKLSQSRRGCGMMRRGRACAWGILSVLIHLSYLALFVAFFPSPTVWQRLWVLLPLRGSIIIQISPLPIHITPSISALLRFASVPRPTSPARKLHQSDFRLCRRSKPRCS